MWLVKRLMLSIAVLAAAVVGGLVHAQTTDAPYVYYFSREVNAFIIERADGTERHWLGQGLARDYASRIDGPGWSPSGEWLAWTENRFTKEQNHGDNPFVIRADGSGRLTLLDAFNNAQMAWAPGEADVLLVVGTKNELVGESDTMVHMLLIDMATETVLNAVEVQRPARKYYLSFEPEEVHYLLDGRVRLDWLPGGTQAAVYLDGLMDFNGNVLAPNVLYVLDGTGGVDVRETSPLNVTDPMVSAQGVVAHRDDSGQLALENLLSGQRGSVSVEGGFAYPGMRWSPDGRYLLAQGADKGLYLVDASTFTATLLDPAASLSHYVLYDGLVEYWSPGSEYVVFAVQSADQPTIFNMYLLDIATQARTQLPVHADYGDPAIELGGWQWTGLDEITLVMRHADPRAWEFTRYHVSTGSTQVAATSGQQTFLTTAFLSPSGRYIASFNEVVVFTDVQSGGEVVYPPDSRSYLSNMVGEVAWYPGDDWVILYEDAGVAGGGVLRWTGVARPDGGLRQELGWCSGLGQQCIGWLPPQVDVNSLPIAPPLHDMTEPVQTLTGTHWNYYLAWSPDGTHLAAGSDGHGYGTLSVWDLAANRVAESIALDEVGSLTEEAFRLAWQPDHTLLITPGDPVASPRTYSPDGRLYVETYYASVGVYDASTDVMLHPLGIGNFNWALSFTHDGRFLAVLHDEFPAYLLDTTTWETVLTFEAHATAAAFSPDNRQLALANGWDVQIWDLSGFYASIGYEPGG